MIQINCKCGNVLLIEEGASEVVCKACNHAFRIRMPARPAPPAPAAAPIASTPHPLPVPPTATAEVPPPQAPAAEDSLPPRERADERTRSRGEGSAFSTKPRPAAARSGTKTAIRHRDESAAHSATPSIAPKIVAALGALMALAGVALLAFASPSHQGANDSATTLLKKKKAELRQKLETARAAFEQEQTQPEKLKRGIAAEKQKTSDLKYESEMLDTRFRAAARSTAASDVAKARADAERDRREMQDQFAPKADGGGAGLVMGAQKAVIVVFSDRGSGSGFIIEPEGVAVTNYHVVAESSRLMAKIQTRASTEQTELRGVKVLACDKEMDLALLQLPAAPDTVGINGDYPTVDIRERPVELGEKVYAIGAPGFTGGVLDFTVTAGIVSHPARGTETARRFQTTCPVNPGNSGGPMFDERGTIVGVVSAKSLEAQAVSFAIPSESLNFIMRRRKEDPYVVKTGLRDWELAHNPAVAQQAVEKEWAGKCGTLLPSPCNDMIVSPDGKSLYLLNEHPGKIFEYSIAANKLGKTYDPGFALSSAASIGSGAQLLALSPQRKKLLVLDAKSLELQKDAPLRSAAMTLAYLGGPNDSLLLLSPFGGAAAEALLVDKHDLLGGTAGVELPKSLAPLCCAQSNKFAAFLTLDADHENATLRVLPAQPCTKLLDEWGEIRRKNSTMDDETLQSKLSALAKSLAALEKTLALKMAGDDAETGRPLFADAEHLIMGRKLYKLGEDINPERDFEGHPQLADPDKLSPEQKRHYKRAELPAAVSEDGKFAASLAHVYSVATGKIVAKLPFVVEDIAFSKDGKTLFALNSDRHILYRFVDWEKLLPAP